MSHVTFSSREFNQHVSRAKRAADDGPVVITDRGKPAYVLMSHDEFSRLAGTKPNIVDLLRMPGIEDIELDIPKRQIDTRPPVEFD